MEEQVSIFYALNQGYLDKIPTEEIAAWQEGFLQYLHEQDKKVLSLLAKEKDLTDKVIESLEKALQAYGKIFTA